MDDSSSDLRKWSNILCAKMRDGEGYGKGVHEDIVEEFDEDIRYFGSTDMSELRILEVQDEFAIVMAVVDKINGADN